MQQLRKSYVDGGREPAIGENMGRSRKLFDEREAQVVGEAYALYRFGARMLEVVVRKAFKIRISYNRIHMNLRAAGLAHEDQKKKNRCKWVPIRSILRRDLQSLIASLSNDWPPLGKIEVDCFNFCIITVYRFKTISPKLRLGGPTSAPCSRGSPFFSIGRTRCQIPGAPLLSLLIVDRGCIDKVNGPRLSLGIIH